jgi:hypothetical protein
MSKVAVLLAALMLSGCMISAGPARPGSDCGQLGCLSQPDKSQDHRPS